MGLNNPQVWVSPAWLSRWRKTDQDMPQLKGVRMSIQNYPITTGSKESEKKIALRVWV